MLYMISILCGSSFTGIELCRSNLFRLPIFDIPLTKKAALNFKTKKIYSTVIFENLSQLILAVWYVGALKETPDPIVFISMTFSLVSIIITIISMCTTKQLVY